MHLPRKLSRYASVATLFLKHRHAFEATPSTKAEAEQLANDLERLGPTFVKLGQLMSTRGDLLPPVYIEALSRLQDRVSPFPFEQAQTIVEGELGVRLSKAFGEFEETPIAAASLGQVHRAALRDGRLVAVKVQRPGIREQVADDLATLDEIAEFLDKHTTAGARYRFADLIAEFRKTTMAELDYEREAANLRVLGRNLADFKMLVVPQPVDDYTTGRVLTMDYVLGTKITALSPLTRLDVDAEHLGAELVRAYLHQIVADGFFHADPHPGNVFLTDDGRLALVDLGMVGHLSARLQERLLELLIAVGEGRADEAADVLIELGERLEGFEEAAWRRDLTDLIARYRHSTLADLQVGRLLLDVNQASGARGLKSPADLAMLGKTLLNLDHVARTLAPSLDVNSAIRDEALTLTRRRMMQSVSPGRVLGTMIEAKHLAERLPGRVSRVLEALAGNELRLKVEMIDEGAVIDGLQKVANRIALGLVLAALIVAAAMIMQVPTTFRLFGYPGLAMILFLLAATGGALLAIQILTHDRATRTTRR